MLFLGSLLFWNMHSIWFGSWALDHLQLDQHTDSSKRILQFVLLKTRGRDAGRQTHHAGVFVPESVGIDELRRVAAALDVSLRPEAGQS